MRQWVHIPECQRCTVYRFHQGFIQEWVHFPACQSCTVCWFPQLSFSGEFTFPIVRGAQFHSEVSSHSRVSEVHSLSFSSGFLSAVSSLSPVSEVHNLLISLAVSFSSEFTFPSVGGAQFTGSITVSFSSEFTFSSVTGAHFIDFIRVSVSGDFTFPSVRGAQFGVFVWASLSREFTFLMAEVHSFLISSGFHSLVSSLSRVWEVHSLFFHHGLIQLWVHFPECERCTVHCFIRVSFSGEFTLRTVRGAQFIVSSRFLFPVSSLTRFSEVHSILISSGFHSAVSSLSQVSALHSLLISFRVSFSSEFTFPSVSVAVYWFHSGFRSAVSSLSRVWEVYSLLFPHGFIQVWVHLP